MRSRSKPGRPRMELDLDVALAPNPSPMTGKGTNTYVLGHDEGVVVIDPGPADGGHLDHVEALVRARGRAAMVLMTHHHIDHSEAGPELARRLGAPLAAAPHPMAPPLDRALGLETLEFDGLHLTVLPTPGHCRDHVCLAWEEELAIFAGDLVAGDGFIVIDPPEGDMTDYLDSLRRIASPELFDLRGRARVLLPGHGPALEEPQLYLAGYVAHRLEREAKVLGALPTDQHRPPEKILPLAYADTPEAMYPVAVRSLQAHLDKLVRDGRAEVQGGAYRRRVS